MPFAGKLLAPSQSGDHSHVSYRKNDVRHGHDVLIDGILVERPEIAPHYQQLMDIFVENPLYIVEVDCPLEICRARNVARGDRYETQSEEQAALMAKDIQYAMTVHSDQMTSAECADAIVNRLIK